MTTTQVFEALKSNIKTIFEEDGQMDPVAFFHWAKTGQTELLPVPTQLFEDPRLKNTLSQMLAAAIRRFQPSCMIIVMETWVIRLAPGHTRDEFPENFADHPDRKEVVTVLGEDALETIMWQAEITRDAESRPHLGEFEKSDATVGGRFTHLFMSAAPEGVQ